MRENVFLFKLKDDDDRDCCGYIDNKPLRWECDHYFGGIYPNGACYCGGELPKYDEIRTVLTEDEYNALVKFANDIKELGYGIKKGDERYNKGIEYCNQIQPIYDKLNGPENKEFFETIIEEEIAYLMDEYCISRGDILDVFDNYSYDYRDRSVIGYVYDNYYDLGYNEAFSLGYLSNDNDAISRFFDYERFGESLVEEDSYYETDSGKIIYLNV